MIPYIRGWIGVVCFLMGIGMAFFDATKQMAFLVLGFGIGMMSSGFQ